MAVGRWDGIRLPPAPDTHPHPPDGISRRRRSGTSATRAPRCGSIPTGSSSWCFSRTASTRRARTTRSVRSGRSSTMSSLRASSACERRPPLPVIQLAGFGGLEIRMAGLEAVALIGIADRTGSDRRPVAEDHVVGRDSRYTGARQDDADQVERIGGGDPYFLPPVLPCLSRRPAQGS